MGAAVFFALLAAGYGAVPAHGQAPVAAAGPLAGVSSPQAESPSPAELFLRSSEALYDSVMKDDIMNTLLYLRQTETRLRGLPMQRIATAEGVEALAASVTRMRRAVAAVSPDPDKWKAYAAEIRLAADALAHPDKPLWHRYRTVLQEDAAGLAAALRKSGVSDAARAELDRLDKHYRLIRTSVLLQAEPYVTERADSILTYARRLLASPKTDPELLSRLVPSLQETMDGLFPGKGKDKAAVVPPVAGPPWGWSAFMGTFIVTVLTWVGWRRYQAVDPVTPRGNLPPEHHERR